MFSDPVVGGDFFGRQPIIDLLVKRADALKSGYRQNIAIIGHQQLGKTSLLRQFLTIYRDPQVISIYVEIKFQALDYFVDQFIRSLLFQYLSEKENIDPVVSLPELARKAAVTIPRTVAKIDEIVQLLRHRQAEEAYSKLFQITSTLQQETGKNCIVILDEFHRLGEFGIKNAFSDFGKRIMVQKDTMYVLASSSFSASRKILAEKLALLFGNFERIYLKAFDFETSYQFIEKKLEPVRISETLKSFLVAFTDGHPFFLQTLVTRLQELSGASGETEISPRSIAETLLKLLYESQGVFNQYFLKLLSPWTGPMAQGSHVLILTEMAKGKNRLKEVSLAVNRRQREVSEQIRSLMEHELIVKNGVFFQFHNKIFKFWLKEVYEKKELSLLGLEAKSESFLDCIRRLIADHEELLGMETSDRVLKLFSLFQNDIVELGEKRRKLPHFTEIIKSETPADTSGSSREIIARGHGRCWVCKIVEGEATEKEVLDLVGGFGRKNASVTRVLLALRGLDENARLLAKEKGVLTLGLARINMLMDLYGKAPIIRVAPAVSAET